MSGPPIPPMWSSPHPHALRRFAETLIVAAAGGAVLGLTGFPAGWLSGSIVAVSTAALLRRPVLVPDAVARVAFVAIGISLGGAATPETLTRMATWPASLAMLTVVMLAVTISVALYLHRVHGWDALSALFAAAPGGMAQSLALAAESGRDLRSIAMIHAVRVMVLTVALPVGMAAFGVSGASPLRNATASIATAPLELIGLVAVSAGAAALAYRLRLPGGLILGAMASSGVLHGIGLVRVGLPSSVAIASFVALGAVIGARFAGADLRLLRRLTMVGLGALAVGGSVAAGCAVAVSALLALRIGDLVIAYAPGGLEAMTILAFALNLDPVFVGVHQIARLVIVSTFVPFAVHYLGGADPVAKDSGDDGAANAAAPETEVN